MHLTLPWQPLRSGQIWYVHSRFGVVFDVTALWPQFHVDPGVTATFVKLHQPIHFLGWNYMYNGLLRLFHLWKLQEPSRIIKAEQVWLFFSQRSLANTIVNNIFLIYDVLLRLIWEEWLFFLKNPYLLPVMLRWIQIITWHLSGSAFYLIDIGLPQQAVGGFTLGLGLVVEDRPTELSWCWHGLDSAATLGFFFFQLAY